MERGSLTPCLAASRVVGVGAATLVCPARGLLEPPCICQASERARVGSPRDLGCGLWAACGWGWPGLRLVPCRGQKGVQKAYSTRYSQAVSHPSTNQARPCLASEIRRDRARSGWYGRRRGRPSPTSPKSLLRSLSRPPGPPGPPPPHTRRPASPEPRATSHEPRAPSPESRVPSPQPRAQTTESPHLRKLPARRRVRPSAPLSPARAPPARPSPGAACLPASRGLQPPQPSSARPGWNTGPACECQPFPTQDAQRSLLLSSSPPLPDRETLPSTGSVQQRPDPPTRDFLLPWRGPRAELPAAPGIPTHPGPTVPVPRTGAISLGAGSQLNIW